MRINLVFLLWIALSVPAMRQAAGQGRWVTLAHGDPTLRADSTTSRRHGDHLDIWIQQSFSEPHNLTPTGKTKLLYTDAVGRWAINCNTRVFQSIEDVYHSARGDVIYSNSQTEADDRWEGPVPETIGEAVVDSVCAKEGLFDGSYAQALQAYRDRWSLLDSARRLECRAADNTAILAPCAKLSRLKGASAATESERWRLRWQIDSTLGNTWPDSPAMGRKRPARP